MTKNEHVLSALPKTWVFDLDGTVVKHNGHLTSNGDVLLEGARDFFDRLDPKDSVIFLTSRDPSYKGSTEKFLKDNKIRFDLIIYGLPYGERILINDRKPSGLITALAINTERDNFMKDTFITDDTL